MRRYPFVFLFAGLILLMTQPCFWAAEPSLDSVTFYDRKVAVLKMFGQTHWGDCSPGHVDSSHLYHAAGEPESAFAGVCCVQQPQRNGRRQRWLFQGGTDAQREPAVPLQKPLEKATPDAVIQLPLGAPGEIVFDGEDNLIVQDHPYNKVWVINFDRDPVWLRELK